MAISATESKQAVEQVWTEAMGGDLDALDRLMAENVTYREPGIELHGVEAVKSHMSGWLEGFPDFTFDVKEAVVEDDLVMTYFTATGTHEGPLHGIPATGKRFEGEGVQIDRFEDGEVVEEINIWDNLTLFEQLEIDPSES